MRRTIAVFLLLGGVAMGQNGIAPIWDVKAMLGQLTEHADRYRTAVDKLAVVEWVNQKQASQTYLKQQEVVLAEVGHLKTVAERLSKAPEKLSLALDIYFRLQALESVTAALAEGVSRYESADKAASLNQLVSDNTSTRMKLRQYVMDLSVNKEQEYQIAEREAQRCQAELNRNPLAPVPITGPRKKQQEKK
ncbi:MAG: hypothetical protein JNK48_11070 [Bryobacterales bacterium]|nr:hypothetical protein [Bryobacterales bacterium]